MQQAMLLLIAYTLAVIIYVWDAFALPDVDRNSFTTVNMCYTEKSKTVCKKFKAPDIIEKDVPVDYIFTSPLDPSRTFDAIPTAELARYHLWIITVDLLRAQKQYSGCVEEKSAYQRLLSRVPDSSPQSPNYPIVVNVRDYTVPFLAETTHNPNRPPTRKDLIAHVKAAVDSVNITVFYTGICRYEAQQLRQEVVRNKSRIR